MSSPGDSHLDAFFDQFEQLHRVIDESSRRPRAVMFADITASTEFFHTHGDFEGVYLIHQYGKAMRPVIARHSGEVVKSLGDGLLAVFESSEAAATAAIEMQQATSEVNDKLGKKDALSITIGIHYGEVFFHGGDVFGDAVNVAARTSSAAGPGTILISREVQSRLDPAAFLLSFGTRARFKGKPHPTDLYLLHWEPEELARGFDGKPQCDLRAFISTGTPHNDAQIRFTEGFSRRLFSIGVEPQFLAQTYYDRRDPIGRTREQIASCDFVIVIGLERSHAYFLKEKELSDAESEAVHRRFPSGWLHLEAGLSNALGKELFVLCAKEICSEGVFDRAWNTYPVYEIDDLNAYGPGMREFWETLAAWLARERGRRASSQASS